jgi:CDP-diacylglycerol--glycerol-3-phosphate 3-phosphatidyltransferase
VPINLPNKLTLTRIVLSPIFMAFLLVDNLVARYIALVLFAVACLTDFWDGFLARKNGCETGFGRFMDPMADKLLVSLAFVSFVSLRVIPAWVVLTMITREIIILGLRMLVAYKGEVMRSSPLARWKTASQMISAVLILLFLVTKSTLLARGVPEDGLPFFEINQILYGLVLAATFLTVVSGLDYLFKNRSLILGVLR